MIGLKKKMSPHIVRYAIICLTFHIKPVNIYSVCFTDFNKTRDVWQNATMRTCFTFKYLYYWEWNLCTIPKNKTHSFLFLVYLHESLNFLPQYVSCFPSGCHPRLEQTKKCNNVWKNNYVILPHEPKLTDWKINQFTI